MTDSNWGSSILAFLVVVALAMLAGFVIGESVGKLRAAEEALKVEEPKNTQHLHLHMEACDQKDRYGL